MLMGKTFLSEPAKRSEWLADQDSRALADRITAWAARVAPELKLSRKRLAIIAAFHAPAV